MKDSRFNNDDSRALLHIVHVFRGRKK